jgi:hypothetical protein
MCSEPRLNGALSSRWGYTAKQGGGLQSSYFQAWPLLSGDRSKAMNTS